MCAKKKNIVVKYLEDYRSEILEKWTQEQLELHQGKLGRRKDDFIEECGAFYDAVLEDISSVNSFQKIIGNESSQLEQIVQDFAKKRVVQGFSPGDTARYVLGWRLAFFIVVGEKHKPEETEPYQEDMMGFNKLAEELSIMVVESFVQERDEIIRAQQSEIMELSTPVIKVWNGILTLPIVGTLDSMRAQQLMENILQEIVETGYRNVIIDISGVPTVDTMTAQHIIKTTSAIRLMGGKCIISGIRPEIATTMVGLGVSLDEHSQTKASMADALHTALNNLGLEVVAKKTQ